MGIILVALGSLIAILLGLFHFLMTRKALRAFPELPRDTLRFLVALWNGVGFLVIYLGAVPLALFFAGAYVGKCKTIVGISVVALAGVLAVADFIAYWPTKMTIGRIVPFVFAVIAALIAVGTFVL